MARPLSRPELFERIRELPAQAQHEAALLALEVYGDLEVTPSERAIRRDHEQRRRYAEQRDPAAYIRDVFGYRLTAQQESVLALIEAHDKVLVASGNNLGKTWFAALYGVYVLDARGALRDDENNLEEQGARVLLPGPDHKTVFDAVYSKMLAHAIRAESRGFMLPGWRSDKSVLWRVRPEWDVIPFSPPKRRGVHVEASASGRHHRNQIAIFEEAKGATEALWNGVETMCSGDGNKILAIFNPTEASGPAYLRSMRSEWKVLELSALDHPNVRSRSAVFPGAISFRRIDKAVQDRCLERGTFPEVKPDPQRNEFVYALPPTGARERGGRKDGMAGHPDGTPRVYRPDPVFESTVMGRFPSQSDNRLFSRPALIRSNVRWRLGQDPDGPPRRVGLDPAREGGDDTVAAPAWGEALENILRRYTELEGQPAAAIERWKAANRLRIGTLTVIPKGDGVDTARAVDRLFPDSAVTIDETGVGYSSLDHAARVLKKDWRGVSFASAPAPPLPGEEVCENLKTQLFVRLARAVVLDLADLPPDEMLVEELLALWLHRDKTRTVEVEVQPGRFESRRKDSVLLASREEVKRELGRSPDRASAVAIVASEPVPSRRAKVTIPGIVGGR